MSQPLFLPPASGILQVAAEAKMERTVYVEGTKVYIREPKEIRRGIVLYGWVLSAITEGKTYWVRKKRTGQGRFSYACTCEASFLAGHTCKHVAKFILAERQNG